MNNLKPGNFCLEGYIDVPSEQLSFITNALEEHVRLTREEAGCIFFFVEPSRETEGRFNVREAFVDEAAFRFHQQRASSSAWGKASEGIPRHYKTWVVE